MHEENYDYSFLPIVLIILSYNFLPRFSKANRKAIDEHLDLHFMQARKERLERNKAKSRGWYVPDEVWSEKALPKMISVDHETGPRLTRQGATGLTRSQIEQRLGFRQTNCDLCWEVFETKEGLEYDAEEPILIGAVIIQLNGKVTLCHKDCV